MDEDRLIHDCAKAATLALCNDTFGEKDDAYCEMYAAVYPYVKAAILSYVEFSGRKDDQEVLAVA